MNKIKQFITDNLLLLAFATAFGFIAVISLLSGIQGLIVGIISLLCCTATVCYMLYIKRINYASQSFARVNILAVDMISKLALPVLLYDSNKVVINYNPAFAKLDFAADAKYGHSIKELFDSATPLSNDRETAKVYEFTINGKVYRVNVIGSSDGSTFLSIWQDVSVINSLNKKLSDKNIVIGYAAVDNASEVSGYLQDKFRKMVAKAYTELYNWVTGMNGIIIEYERDKYLILVEREMLESNYEKGVDGKGFAVLEKISNAVSGEMVRVTVSMGFGNIDGELSEKDNAAREALDTAFQRGGATVVVKEDGEQIIFGGTNRATSKSYAIESRNKAQQLVYWMSQSSDVFVMGHERIDYDAIAAACAVARMAMSLNKTVHIVVNFKDKALRDALNILGELDEYTDVFIDSVKALEMLSAESLLVVVDVNNGDIFESKELYNNCNTTIIIDHHSLTSRKSDDITLMHIPVLQYIDPTASSASEIMCEMLEHTVSRKQLTPQETELLYAGLLLDTQKFTRNMGVRTFRVVTFLQPETQIINDAQSLFKSTINEYQIGAAFQNNTIFEKDIFAIACYDGAPSPDNRTQAAIAADKMITLEGIKASFAIAQLSSNVVFVSARSDGSVNCQAIVNRIGGDGGFNSAGAGIEAKYFKVFESDMSPIEAATVMVRGALDQYYIANMASEEVETVVVRLNKNILGLYPKGVSPVLKKAESEAIPKQADGTENASQTAQFNKIENNEGVVCTVSLKFAEEVLYPNDLATAVKA